MHFSTFFSFALKVEGMIETDIRKVDDDRYFGWKLVMRGKMHFSTFFSFALKVEGMIETDIHKVDDDRYFALILLCRAHPALILLCSAHPLANGNDLLDLESTVAFAADDVLAVPKDVHEKEKFTEIGSRASQKLLGLGVE
ncbi:hypothetical protein HPP92_012042 [Vanilla planifolia]|uniref:Uncharacterized protein n=1 Tax=Vanilla planifolia TaxID=51239 RepID=A0A835R305_VANPL|nr:hypothetical protein HPP92_012042 [Vanilla planifolia]